MLGSDTSGEVETLTVRGFEHSGIESAGGGGGEGGIGVSEDRASGTRLLVEL